MKASKIHRGILRDGTGHRRRDPPPLGLGAAALLLAGIVAGCLLAARLATTNVPPGRDAAELDGFRVRDPAHAGTPRAFRHVSATRWIEQRPDGKDWAYDVVSGEPLRGCAGTVLVGGGQAGALFVPAVECRSRTVFHRAGDGAWLALGEMLPLR